MRLYIIYAQRVFLLSVTTVLARVTHDTTVIYGITG